MIAATRNRTRATQVELFRCTGTPPRGLTVLSRADRLAVDAALSAVRDWAVTRDGGPALDESALTMLAATLWREHVAPLRAELAAARAEVAAARDALAVANAELAERRETERAARVRREMAAERRNPQLRAEVRERDGDNCRLCGTDLEADAGVLDHLAPDLAAGLDNVVMACPSCRRKRKGRTVSDAGMTLLPVPDAHRFAVPADEPDAVGPGAVPIAIKNPITGRRLIELPRAEAVAWAEGIIARCREPIGATP